MVLNDCKKRHINLGMAWINYKKAYDMIPQSLTLESLGLVEVSENIRKSMKNCNTSLASCWVYLVNVDIRRVIFHGNSLSPLPIVICMIPLTQILKEVKKGSYQKKILKSGYTLKIEENLNSLWKIFPKSKREVNGLVSTAQILNNVIWMEFGTKKCGVLVLNWEK